MITLIAVSYLSIGLGIILRDLAGDEEKPKGLESFLFVFPLVLWPFYP